MSRAPDPMHADAPPAPSPVPTLGGEAFVAALGHAARIAACEPGPERALGHLTALAHDALGDLTAVRRPGALLDGERDYRVAGVFVITPDQRYNMLVANRGFPAEQRRLAIPITWNHPGEVVRTEAPILLSNTDEHGAFRQFLKTSRMGSSIYYPIHTRSGMVAQIVAAAQTRWTYGPADLERLGALAGIAAALWQSTGASDWLAQDYPAADLWRAEEKA
ncbi:MAG: GAF domain-containing protein [Pseudomonadota bacterium]